MDAGMKEPLRAAVEREAKGRGVSMNTEMNDRLEQAYANAESFRVPEIENIAGLVAAAFLMGGQGARWRSASLTCPPPSSR
jgi:hypothetical protein